MTPSTTAHPPHTPEGLEAQFCGAMDAAPVMIWVSEAANNRFWFNRVWLDFTGQPPGGDWADGLHPEDRDRALENANTHFDARKPFRQQYRLRRRDGEFRWIDETATPRETHEGGFLGHIGACFDVHDETTRLENEIAGRARAEKDSARSSDQLAILIDGIQDYAIYMMDPEGRVVSWNSGAARIKFYASEEVLGKHFSIFYTEDDREQGVPAQALELARIKGKHEAEGWRRRKDGSQFWASTVINAVHDKDGKLLGFAKVTRDVTDKRRTEEMLEEARGRLLQAQKMEAIGQLTGGVAHDFNNLLTVIIGNLARAKRDAERQKPSPSRLLRALGNALRGAGRATALTQRLLAFSRRQPLSPKPLDVNKFIAGEVQFLQRSLGERIEVLAVGSAGLWRVEADHVQLESALLNLAVNARDAVGDQEGGKLTIETSNAFLDEEYCAAESGGPARAVRPRRRQR